MIAKTLVSWIIQENMENFHLKVIEIFFGADQNLMSLMTLGLKPFILVSGQEHHSNLLPWKEAGCEIVTIGSLSTGTVYTLGQ